MQNTWVEITSAGHHDVVAGLFRERQLEMAMDKMEYMFQEGITIQPWLFDMATYILLETDEVDEACRLVQHRLWSDNPTMTPSMWFLLLEKASAGINVSAASFRCPLGTCTDDMQYRVAQFVWARQVQPRYLNPSEGICLNVLQAAARQGDSDLAQDVFRVLGERGTIFESQHYEMLAEAHLKAQDLRAAMEVMCIAESAGIAQDDSTTALLHQTARKEPSLPRQAFQILQSLKDEGRQIPVAMVNSIIGAAAQEGQIDEAIEQYKALRSICPDGPSIQTFNILLRGCRNQQKKNLAMFLAAEMLASGISPNALTYERIIETCVASQAINDALLYLDEMGAQKMVPREGTAGILLEALESSGDGRLASVRNQLRELGVDLEMTQAYTQARGAATRNPSETRRSGW
jgi:pentatricopeptide repeat protein